jgi:hypothetical protein
VVSRRHAAARAYDPSVRQDEEASAQNFSVSPGRPTTPVTTSRVSQNDRILLANSAESKMSFAYGFFKGIRPGRCLCRKVSLRGWK